MDSLPALARKQLRVSLLRHRQGFALSEADYVEKVLKVSLNTYKKCVDELDDTDLRLKRRTLISILKAAKIDPASLGLDVLVPSASHEYGGYDPEDFKYLVGTYFTHRRSFLTARNIVRGILTISLDQENRCFAFEEYNNYISDAGLHDETFYNGAIHINRDRNLFSFHATNDGQNRLLMAQNPIRTTTEGTGTTGHPRVLIRGVLLTHGVARGVWQPTVSAIAMESLLPSMWKNARSHCRTIAPDDPDFAAIALEIAFAEEHSTVMTPLMWAKLPPPARPAR